MERYGICGDEEADLSAQPDGIFDDWTLAIPLPEGALDIVCCPEDHECDEGCAAQRPCCPKCQLPVCRACEAAMAGGGRPAMPPAAMANVLMIFYAPRRLSTQRVTVMEMICANTCITTMISFTFEAKYRHERALDTEMHMARHRIGARGNATSFSIAMAIVASADAGHGRGEREYECPGSATGRPGAF